MISLTSVFWLAFAAIMLFTGKPFSEIMLPLTMANIWIATMYIMSTIKEKL